MTTGGVASAAAKMLRRHTHMIKFPERIGLKLSFPPPQSTSANVARSPQVSAIPSLQMAAPVSTKPHIGYIPRGAGIDDRDLPTKYRQKPLSDAEIQYILRGGPE